MLEFILHYYAFSLFLVALAGFIIHRHHLITLLICLELMLLSINTNFVLFSRFSENIDGQILVFFTMTIAAAEAALGLALLVLVFRKHGHIKLSKLEQLKG